MAAVDADGEVCQGAQVAEITDLVDLSGYPEGTRLIVRRERPHPGAQLSLFDTIADWRHQVFATDTHYASGGSIQFLEARRRAHARVEDRIRCGQPQLVAGDPALPAQNVALQQREERLHRGAIAAGADPAHRPDQAVGVQGVDELPGPELTGLNRWRNTGLMKRG